MSSGSSNQHKVVCKEMAYYCFDTLVNYLNKSSSSKVSPTFTNDPYPLFVTWQMNGDLRGCIGTFNPIKLHHGIKDYAIKSAIEDNRFNPIELGELNQLSVSVSLLTNFEPAKDYLDWQIGVHGIRIEFLDDYGNERSSTYLPEVAIEHNMDHIKAIDSLLRKGGFRGQITQNLRESIKVVRYQSEKLSVSYPEYQEWKRQQK